MKPIKIYPKCSHRRIYFIRRGKYRCASCKYEWIPHRLPLYLSRDEWIKILKWFLHGISSKAISYETGINRRRVLRALTVVRIAMSKNIPEIFSGTIEVDETHIGGQ